ncbi:MAG: hypothetical protein OMM_02617 [Candidatus Magnetoglobus multicellularis str. Araruama]|uniref:Uncharacterized protein n=1 Tax=Candidatus Magnetoglobus multicellularis str. Araruama TaxID=890399 RepID=A0A1V1P8Q7_9BACT|nr:MAG: hypothetical protein OMM_02617 [Candidatus Magnetoglobus multicellularis str. Araruama]
MVSIPNTKYTTMIWIKYSDRLEQEPGGRVTVYARHCTWDEGNWNSCIGDCGSGTGTKTRSVRCLNGNGTHVNDRDCNGFSKPSTTESCPVDCGYYWDSGSWSSCNPDCGYGTQTRSVVCRDKFGSSHSDYKCSGSKPETSRSCYVDCGYYWDTGSWSSCSSTCGAGTQSRSVTCRNKYGSSQSDAKCSGAGSKPDTNKSCIGDASYCYSWFTGEWSDCSNQCGYGNKTRLVECRNYNGNVSSDSKCSGSKPNSSETCSEFFSCKDPVATIETVQPMNVSVGEYVEFNGSGSDPDGGNIQVFQWRSTIDGLLSELHHFQKMT